MFSATDKRTRSVYLLSGLCHDRAAKTDALTTFCWKTPKSPSTPLTLQIPKDQRVKSSAQGHATKLALESEWTHKDDDAKSVLATNIS